MPYGTPASDPQHAQYVVAFVDSVEGDDLMVNLTFQSGEMGPPTEAERDDFMQRVIDALAAGDGLVLHSAAKRYVTTQDITVTP
jgi:hypothetical protein